MNTHHTGALRRNCLSAKVRKAAVLRGILMLSVLAALSGGWAFGQTADSVGVKAVPADRHGDIGNGSAAPVPVTPPSKALADPLNLGIGQVSIGDFPFIQCYLSVWDAAGQGIQGLTEANFRVTEQGPTDLHPVSESITVTEVSGGTGGISVGLIMDRSGSMDGTPIDDAINSAVSFIDNLFGADRAAIVDFSTDVNIGCPYVYADGTGKTALKNAVRMLYANGSTSLNDAILKGIELTAMEVGAKAVIAFTDGGENNSTHTDDQVIAAAVNAGIPVYTIGIQSYDLNPQRLENLAVSTGGQFYLAPSAADLLGVYQTIKARVLSQYVVTYRTANAVQDNTTRAVTVTVNVGPDSATKQTTYRANLAPQIRRTAGTVRLGTVSQPAGEPITIAADVFDYEPIASARLFYRVTGSGSAFQQVPMATAGTPGDPTLYVATIPSTAVVPPGLDYFLTASDGVLTTSSPVVTPQIYPHKIPVMPNSAPVIQHVPITYSPPNQDVAITATATDTTDFVKNVTLFYRSAATPAYVAVPMNRPQGDTYEGTIPADVVAPPGVDYYLQAVDNFGTASCHGTADAPHRINYGASDVTVAARWYEIGTGIVVTAVAQDRMNGGTVNFGSGTFTVYDPQTAIVAEGGMKFDTPLQTWTSGFVPFDHAGRFTVEVSINGLVGTLSFVVDLQSFNIDGTVAGPNGTPAADATISLCSALTGRVLAVGNSDTQQFGFGTEYGIRPGWYYLTATKDSWSTKTPDFFISDSMTFNLELSDNKSLPVAAAFSVLTGQLAEVARHENRLLSDMSGSVDRYLKTYGAAGTMLDVVNLGLGTVSVNVDLPWAAGRTPFTDPVAALRYLNAFIGVTGGAYKSVRFPHPWFTDPPFTEDFVFGQWYGDWAYGSYFHSVTDGGTAFGTLSGAAGAHLISAADLDNDGPFTGFAAALATTNATLLDFLQNSTPASSFSPDKAFAYVGARIGQLNAWRGSDDRRSQIMLCMPESLSSEAVLAMRPLYARYEKDRGAADTLTAAKTRTVGVKTGAMRAGFAGPVPVTVGTGSFAAATALDCTEMDVKGDLEQTWGLAGATRLLDLAQMAKYGAGMSEFIQTEAAAPYYLDASKHFSSALESVQTSFASTGLFGLPKTSVVQVDVTARNIGSSADITLYAENYGTEGLYTLLADAERSASLLPFLTGDFRVTSLTDSGMVRSPGRVALDGTTQGHFELLTGAGFLAQLMDIQFVDVLACNGPWVGAEKTAHYNLIAEELKSRAPAKSDEPSSMIRTSEKALSIKDAADMADRVIAEQHLTLNANQPSFTGSYTASADAHKIVFQLFYPSSCFFGLVVSQADGARVGFDPETGIQCVEFPAVYSGPLAHPQQIDVPGATGKTYTVKVVLAQSAARQAESATLVVIEEPLRPTVMAFYPQDVVKYAAPGSTLTLSTEIAESGKQIPLDGVEMTMGALKNGGGVELPLSGDTPAHVAVPRLMAGTGTGVSFKYTVPENASGTYTGTAEISSPSAGTLTQKVEVSIDSQVPETAIVSAPAGVASPVIKWGGSDTETPAGQLRYSWKLDGVDDDWTLPAAATETTYANLANGQYVFHVRAVDRANHEDPTPAQATFKSFFTLGVNNPANGTLMLNPDGGTFHAGTAVSLVAAPQTGYRVKKWTGTDNDALKTNANTVTMTGDKNVSVEFEPISQNSLTTSVTGGHGKLSPASGVQLTNAVITLTAAPDSGYRVKAWTGTDNDTLKTNANTVTMNHDRTVTVSFELIPAMLNTSVVGGHGTLAPVGGPQAVNAVVTLTATPESGYRVMAWTGTDNDTLKTNANTVTMAGDKTITVAFEPIPCMLTTEVVGGHGSLSPGTGPQNTSAVITLSAVPESGYRIKAWTGTDNDTLTTYSNKVTMTGDKSVTVEFQPMGTLKGSLRVTIQPAEAVTAGAQWSVDGGAAQAADATVSGLSAGQHTVSFTTAEGWTAPADQTVTVTAGQVSYATGTYTAASPTGGGGCAGGTVSGKSLPGPGGRSGDLLILLSASTALFFLGGRRLQRATLR